MPHNRFFTDTHPLKQQQTIVLKDTEFHHLKHVMRKKSGEKIELINGKHQLATGIISLMSKHEAVIEVLDVETYEAKGPSLILIQGKCKFTKLEWILEKGTELGVHHFWICPMAHSEKIPLTKEKLIRMHNICMNATKQCGRLDLPTLEVQKPLLEMEKPEGNLFFGDPEASSLFPIKETFSTSISMIVGPEKGFTEEERYFLIEKWHATPLKLHNNTLRTETAALMAIYLATLQNLT